MIGLDTPVLLRILRGDPRATSLLREWAGEELATTYWNLLELESLARLDPSAGREHRRRALDGLRRRLTVLPFDQVAFERFGASQAAPGQAVELITVAIASTLESRGCRLWVTHGRPPLRGRHWKIQVQSL